MIVSIDGTDYKMTCFHCGTAVESMNSNDDLQCPKCQKREDVVSQAGIISAFEECVTYVAAIAINSGLKSVKGYKPAKLDQPPFMFTAQQ